jgi:hypothetical protein
MASCRSRSPSRCYEPATQQIDLTAPPRRTWPPAGTISKISKRSSTGLALAIVIGVVVLG